MRRKYSIGFLLGVMVLSGLYLGSECWSSARREQVRNQETGEVREVNLKGDEQVFIYYLWEEGGYVMVYDRDGNLFEKTSIQTETLPAEIREKLKDGIGLSGQEELYSFLENYSS